MRAGYYVDGRRYALDKPAQAYARARHLSREYGRHVPVTIQLHNGIIASAPLWRRVPTLQAVKR